MPLFLCAGCRWIMSHRAGITSDMLGHCQAEVTPSASDLSCRTMCALAQSGSRVTCIGSGLLLALVLCGLRRTHTILSTSTTVENNNVLGSGGCVGSGNIVEICVSKIFFAYICIYVQKGREFQFE